MMKGWEKFYFLAKSALHVNYYKERKRERVLFNLGNVNSHKHADIYISLEQFEFVWRCIYKYVYCKFVRTSSPFNFPTTASLI